MTCRYAGLGHLFEFQIWGSLPFFFVVITFKQQQT